MDKIFLIFSYAFSSYYEQEEWSFFLKLSYF